MNESNRADHSFDFAPQTALTYLRGRPGVVLVRSRKILNVLFAAECRRAGVDITEAQLDALNLIAANEYSDQITLARHLGCDRSTVTSVIDGLTQRGLARRRIRGDRRRRSIELAPGTREILSIALGCSDRADQALFSRLSHVETKQVMAVLEELALTPHSSAPAWEPFDPVLRQNTEHSLILPASYLTPRFLMWRCMQIGNSFLTQEFNSIGFTGGQYGVLFLIAALAPVEQAALGRELQLDKSSVSRLLSNLEARGVIARKIDLDDRRRLLVTATKVGLRLLNETQPRAARADQRVFEGLSTDALGRFVDTLSRLVESHSPFVEILA